MSKAYKNLSPRARVEADAQRIDAGGTPRFQKRFHKLLRSEIIIDVQAACAKEANTKPVAIKSFVSRKFVQKRTGWWSKPTVIVSPSFKRAIKKAHKATWNHTQRVERHNRRVEKKAVQVGRQP